MCGSTAECGRAKAETTVRFRSPAPFRGRSSPAERSFDMRVSKQIASDLGNKHMNPSGNPHQMAFATVACILFATGILVRAGEAPPSTGVENKTTNNDVFERRVQQMDQAVQAKEKEGNRAM